MRKFVITREETLCVQKLRDLEIIKPVILVNLYRCIVARFLVRFCLCLPNAVRKTIRLLILLNIVNLLDPHRVIFVGSADFQVNFWPKLRNFQDAKRNNEYTKCLDVN